MHKHIFKDIYVKNMLLLGKYSLIWELLKSIATVESNVTAKQASIDNFICFININRTNKQMLV